MSIRADNRAWSVALALEVIGVVTAYVGVFAALMYGALTSAGYLV